MARTTPKGLLFGGAAAGIFVFGIVMAVLGTLFGLPEMRTRLQIDLAEQGTMILYLYGGIFLATLVSGPAIDASGHRTILVLSSVLVSAGMAGFALAHSYGGAVIPAVLLGCGGGGLNTSTNALVSELYGEQRGPMLNLLGIFYGIGALCIPLLAAAITGHFPITVQSFFCAGLAGVCALLFLPMHFPEASVLASSSWNELSNVVRYPGVLALGFLLFCQSGNEASIAGWTSTYVGETGLSSRAATLTLAGYWAALMLGRLLAARLLKSVGKEQLVFASGVGAFLGGAILLAAHSGAMLVVGVLVMGISYAGIFPTALAIAGDAYRRMVGTVFGLLFAIALVGGMTFPWAVGHISQTAGIRYGMAVPMLGALVICGLAWKIHMSKRKEVLREEPEPNGTATRGRR